MKTIFALLLLLAYATSFTRATPFEVFYSQYEVASPCTGSLIAYDFGKLEIEFIQIHDTTYDVSVKIFATMRHEDILDTHHKKSAFVTNMTDALSLRVNGKDISYILKLGILKTDGKVSAVSLRDIEIAHCKSE